MTSFSHNAAFNVVRPMQRMAPVLILHQLTALKIGEKAFVKINHGVPPAANTERSQCELHRLTFECNTFRLSTKPTSERSSTLSQVEDQRMRSSDGGCRPHRRHRRSSSNSSSSISCPISVNHKCYTTTSGFISLFSNRNIADDA
jgi:hypothetical protein